MAKQFESEFSSPSYLSPNQQTLLKAALASNNPNAKSSEQLTSKAMRQSTSSNWDDNTQLGFGATDTLLDNGSIAGNGLSLTDLGAFDGNLDNSSFLDFLDDNNNGELDDDLQFDLPDGNEDLDGDTGGESPDGEHDLHEKRKSPGDDTPGVGADPKRHEPTEKVAKKPGRKPLMTEPTNKRKAQNRAAQRAFRERKEKHLKDLENKVADLEKSSESTNNENNLLRAQVNRLQTELKEYRKRLSLTGSTFGQSQPLSNELSSYLASTGAATNFNFEFPRFGSLSNSVLGDRAANNGLATPPHSTHNTFSPSTALQDTNNKTQSPQIQTRNNSTEPAGQSPPQVNGSVARNSQLANEGLNAMLSRTANSSRSGSADATAPHPRIFQFNSNSVSITSPSASSNSQYGGNSSCGTSPEPTHNSPPTGNQDSSLHTIDETGSADFLSTFKASTNTDTGAPMQSIGNQANSLNTNKGIDWFAAQNGGQFEPALFGDYRNSQLAIVGDGDFTGGFFNDALPVPDFSSPFNWDTMTTLPTGFTPAVQKPNPIEQAELLQTVAFEPQAKSTAGEPGTMLDCNKLWDKLQGNQDFKDGNFDIDNLCSELRAKARCSEGGVVVDQKDVDAALQRRPGVQGPLNQN